MGRLRSLPGLGLTPCELARIAASGSPGWISTDHTEWILNQLNTMQEEAMLTYPNTVVTIANNDVNGINKLEERSFTLPFTFIRVKP